jgi:hypothetical protein
MPICNKTVLDNLSLYNHYYRKHRGLNTVVKMSLLWQNQANQNAWGSISRTKKMKWVRKTNNFSASSTTNAVDIPNGGLALPHKTFGQPKVTLGNWYYKRYQIVLSNDTFECRNNGGAPHFNIH